MGGRGLVLAVSGPSSRRCQGVEPMLLLTSPSSRGFFDHGGLLRYRAHHPDFPEYEAAAGGGAGGSGDGEAGADNYGFDCEWL